MKPFTHLAVKLYNCFYEMKIVQNASSEGLLGLAGEWRDGRTRHSASAVRRGPVLGLPVPLALLLHLGWRLCVPSRILRRGGLRSETDARLSTMSSTSARIRDVAPRRAGPKNITSCSTSAELEVGSDCGLLCALRLDLGECTVVGRRRRWRSLPHGDASTDLTSTPLRRSARFRRTIAGTQD